MILADYLENIGELNRAAVVRQLANIEYEWAFIEQLIVTYGIRYFLVECDNSQISFIRINVNMSADDWGWGFKHLENLIWAFIDYMAFDNEKMTPSDILYP